jgi:hypothetical protein
MKVVASLRNQFGGHSTEASDRRPAESVTGAAVGEAGMVEPS